MATSDAGIANPPSVAMRPPRAARIMSSLKTDESRMARGGGVSAGRPRDSR